MRSYARPAFLATAAALGALILASPGEAALNLGTLVCDIGGGPGFIVGSSRSITCTYNGPAGPEHYTGSVFKLGMDVGWLSGGQIVWGVFGPNSAPGPARGMLSGNYAGATASAAIGVGAGANALVGGSGQSFTLQPVSFEGQIGLDVAAGLESMSLQYAP
jgi:hypothetical protein